MKLAQRAAVLLSACAAASHAQQTIPSEFDSTTNSLDRLFALGGVGSFQVSQSSDVIYEGGSYRLDIDFNASGVFSFSSVGLGVLNSGASGFLTEPGGDTMSITVRMPEVSVGGLELTITLRDDDNNDGIINAADDDDEWVSQPVPMEPGIHIYNIPLDSFEDINGGTGNDLPDFASGPVGAMVLSFQTATAMPDGRIEVPVTIHIDHVGVYVGSQTFPGNDCTADTNGDGTLTTADFTAWIAAFNAMAPECDQNGDAACTPADFTAWLANFNAGC